MNLVYDIYLVFSLSRWVGNLFTDLSYVVDTIVGCRIYLYNIQGRSISYCTAACTLITRTSVNRMFTGENSVIPEGVTIGKNTAIFGDTDPSDYPDGQLPSGGSIIKAGE